MIIVTSFEHLVSGTGDLLLNCRYKAAERGTAVQELVAEALAAVGLSGVEDVLPSALSGGMRKRIALARAIVRDDTVKDAEQVC